MPGVAGGCLLVLHIQYSEMILTLKCYQLEVKGLSKNPGEGNGLPHAGHWPGPDRSPVTVTIEKIHLHSL